MRQTAARDDGVSLEADCRRVAARYAQLTLELAGVFGGVVSAELIEALRSAI